MSILSHEDKDIIEESNVFPMYKELGGGTVGSLLPPPECGDCSGRSSVLLRQGPVCAQCPSMASCGHLEDPASRGQSGHVTTSTGLYGDCPLSLQGILETPRALSLCPQPLLGTCCLLDTGMGTWCLWDDPGGRGGTVRGVDPGAEAEVTVPGGPDAGGGGTVLWTVTQVHT